jgi:hypothetical protein
MARSVRIGLGETADKETVVRERGMKPRRRRALLVLAVAGAFAADGAAAAARTGLPQHGTLVPGRTLAGVGLGDSAASVALRLGRSSPCGVCERPTRLFLNDKLVGLAVTYGESGRVVAVFTLGAPQGWRTASGPALGQPLQVILELYGEAVRGTQCVGYIAWSMRSRNVVTSFYSDGDAVYGFALTLPGEDVCQ